MLWFPSPRLLLLLFRLSLREATEEATGSLHLLESFNQCKGLPFFAGLYTSFSIQRSVIHVCKQADLKSTLARNRWFWNPYFGTVYRMQQKGLGSLMYGLKDAWLMDLALTNLDKGSSEQKGSPPQRWSFQESSRINVHPARTVAKRRLSPLKATIESNRWVLCYKSYRITAKPTVTTWPGRPHIWAACGSCTGQRWRRQVHLSAVASGPPLRTDVCWNRESESKHPNPVAIPKKNNATNPY